MQITNHSGKIPAPSVTPKPSPAPKLHPCTHTPQNHLIKTPLKPLTSQGASGMDPHPPSFAGMTSPLDDDHAPARTADKPTQSTAPVIGKGEAYISSGAVSVGSGNQINGNQSQYHIHIEHDNHTENHDHSITYNFTIHIDSMYILRLLGCVYGSVTLLAMAFCSYWSVRFTVGC